MITRDPLDGVNGTTTVANPYHYTDNDPINRTDPTGMRPDDCQFPDIQDSITQHIQDLRNGGDNGKADMFQKLKDGTGCGLAEYGDDVAVEVFGTLKTSNHVLIDVAATGQSVETFGTQDDGSGGFRAGAGNYAIESKKYGGGLAAIAWLGYSTPGNMATAAFHDASEGGERLANFIGRLKKRGKIVTVVGLSYASRVAESSVLEFGASPDHVVYLGCLVGGDSLAGRTRAWVGVNTSDYVSWWGGNVSENTWDCSGSCTRFATGSGQHNYNDQTTRENVLKIAMGRCDEVVTYDGQKAASC